MFVIAIIGNLGKDAEIINHNGVSFLSFNVAATNVRRDREGNKVKDTTWVSCTAAPNENLCRYLKKGSTVFVRGKARLSTYQSTNGIAIDVSCRAEELQLITSTADNIDHINQPDIF